MQNRHHVCFSCDKVLLRVVGILFAAAYDQDSKQNEIGYCTHNHDCCPALLREYLFQHNISFYFFRAD